MNHNSRMPDTESSVLNALIWEMSCHFLTMEFPMSEDIIINVEITVFTSYVKVKNNNRRRTTRQELE